MIVVSDTSPLYYAAKIECDYLFPLLFGTVLIPPSVETELQANKDKELASHLMSCTWLHTRQVTDVQLVKNLMTKVDVGESEAIALAIGMSAKYLLIDERRGNQLALQLKLNTVGFLGFLLLAKDAGYVKKIKPLIDRLIAETNFRYAPGLIQQILKNANEL